jgi:hypothetical protein
LLLRNQQDFCPFPSILLSGSILGKIFVSEHSAYNLEIARKGCEDLGRESQEQGPAQAELFEVLTIKRWSVFFFFWGVFLDSIRDWTQVLLLAGQALLPLEPCQKPIVFALLCFKIGSYAFAQG